MKNSAKTDINKPIANTEENITDLLELANEELEQKSKLIHELETKLEALEPSNIKRLSSTQLNELKNFYSTRLGLIIDAISNLNV
jgi:hypothetical protein